MIGPVIGEWILKPWDFKTGVGKILVKLGCQMVRYLHTEVTQDYSKSWSGNEHCGPARIGFSAWEMVRGWLTAAVQMQKRKGCSGLVVGAAEEWQGVFEVTETMICTLHCSVGLQNAQQKRSPRLLSACSIPGTLLCALRFTPSGSVTYWVWENEQQSQARTARGAAGSQNWGDAVAISADLGSLKWHKVSLDQNFPLTLT